MVGKLKVLSTHCTLSSLQAYFYLRKILNLKASDSDSLGFGNCAISFVRRACESKAK